MDSTLLIGDVVERDSTSSNSAQSFDTPDSSTGFPQPKRRWKPSAFKQQRAAAKNELQDSIGAPPSRPTQNVLQSSQDSRAAQRPSFEDVERQRIDQENRQRIASMTPQEIAQAQEDLMNGLNPDLVKRLLQRATIDEPDRDSPFNQDNTKGPNTPAVRGSPPTIQVQSPTEEVPVRKEAKVDAPPVRETHRSRIPVHYDEDKEPPQIPPDLFPITNQPKSTTHFPAPPSLPDIDPSDPNFLENLRSKYFPDLPADPSKLAWMAPIPTTDSPADRDSPYYPHPEIAVSALRFDFRGQFLSPRVSRSIPTSVGLHHHGQAPEAAGYTVAELARLARSAVPAQRCMAFQTLGRILFRLGKGEWGKTINDPIAMGVWAGVKGGKVLETLMEAASSGGGHRGSIAFATEALWLFEKGGWKEKLEGR